jgi:uncharacterized membrane protein
MTHKTRHPHLAKVIDRNIETLIEVQRQLSASRNIQDKIADRITAFSGSTLFLYFHIGWFGAWLLINLGLTPVAAFDPYPFGLLTMIVSLEAIFLSTFVLISQNRSTEVADKRADLDLQVNLLGEYEITKILKLVDAIADHLGLDAGADKELDELKMEIRPDEVLKEMERQKCAHPKDCKHCNNAEETL